MLLYSEYTAHGDIYIQDIVCKGKNHWLLSWLIILKAVKNEKENHNSLVKTKV